MVMTPEIKSWLHKAKLAVEVNSEAKWPTTKANWDTLTWTTGRKYIKVVCESRLGTSISVYCFIDPYGNIFKACSWSKVAKGIRGTTDTVDPSRFDGSTGWLYHGSKK